MIRSKSVSSLRRWLSYRALACAMVLGSVANAVADPVVKLGTYNFDTGLTGQAIPIYAYDDQTSGPLISGNGQHGVQGLDLNVIIADGAGGTLNGGPVFHLGTPNQGQSTNSGYVGPVAGAHVGGDVLTGTIFQSGAVVGPADGGQSTSQILFVGVALSNGVAHLSTTPGVSLIATLYIDTVNVAPGTNWTLSVGQLVHPVLEAASPYYGFDTSLENSPLDFGYDGFNTVLVDGIIHINNVPEPNSVILAGLGFGSLAGWAWRRRKRRAHPSCER